MYVCICNAIRECELRAAARVHPGDVDALYAALGHAPQCGQCLDEAMHIMIEEREGVRPVKLLPSP
jgi:bacterioferritin-associated ferredoxin